MFGPTPLVVLHTAISLIAVAAGLIALVRYKQISPKNLVGKAHIVTAIVQVVTATLLVAATLQVRWLRAQRPQQA